MERWRPETNTFHMYHGECTITLQDFANLTGLLVTGDALYVLGKPPPPPPSGGFLKGDGRVKMGWLHDHFQLSVGFPLLLTVESYFVQDSRQLFSFWQDSPYF
ncbi:Protein MAIN-LIKE 2 [Linum grandiflorum]